MDETKVHIQNQLWKERLSSALENCYHQVGEKNHCDVSIVTEDGIFVKAHKLVLAIGSGYFRAALQGVSEHQYPIVELPNIASEELLYLIEFMYNGRTSVDKCVLKKVLDASQMLDIKSLSHVPNDESFQTYMAEWDDVDSHVRSDPPTQLALPTARRSLVTPEAPQGDSDAVKSLFLDKTSNGQLTAQGYEEQLLGMDLSLSRGQAGPFARHIPMSVDDAPTKHNIDFQGGPSKRPNNNNFVLQHQPNQYVMRQNTPSEPNHYIRYIQEEPLRNVTSTPCPSEQVSFDYPSYAGVQRPVYRTIGRPQNVYQDYAPVSSPKPICYPVNMNLKHCAWVNSPAVPYAMDPRDAAPPKRRRLKAFTTPTPYVTDQRGCLLSPIHNDVPSQPPVKLVSVATSTQSDNSFNKTVRPPNAYMLYVQGIHTHMRNEHPDKSPTEILKQIALSWNQLSRNEKKGWETKAQDLKATWINQQRAHNKKLP